MISDVRTPMLDPSDPGLPEIETNDREALELATEAACKRFRKAHPDGVPNEMPFAPLSDDDAAAAEQRARRYASRGRMGDPVLWCDLGIAL
ncbi:hypothetical protein H2509_20450 [Stappia sp. F7233]|uniref:Uncharacterized protein n=1 Tax=Stappia albiluteola TaxID=2758565 RepID=A0A839AEJ0_9HYPH|nr:hypothetical protein [Stappia albiluteola]MBA5778230.1 hypothetical protein [Stappia albiluteola]MBA5778244.1 hypothetical protein [Stappia albiluteola]MBA5779478.1 hypothetical protein [Stappia albiluteola]MBA5779508.1 hypothetical protein [Stappia albiluteola]